MTPKRWQQVKEIFNSAVQYKLGGRAAFLSQACGEDEALRKEVESLIASHEKDGSFIDSPAYNAAAGMLANDPELIVGQKIGQYEVISLLGKGGMGEVYLAQDTKLGRKVALKFLPSDVIKDKDRLRRFEQEARAASALNHPNIITIYEIGEADGRRFMATEFVDGETLRQPIAAGPLETGEALNIAEQIASALAEAHAAGIIHRDIKPENIMLRRDGIVKVLDFGLAKLAEPKESGPEDLTRDMVKTGSGIVMGTTTYMSPEQARGLPVDARTDIWSLGVTLYEMLSNRVPFAGATNSDVLASILEREPKSLSPGVPEALEWIVTKTLTKNRDDRYQTAREMLNDIRRLAQRLNAAAELERGVASPASTNSATPRETSPETSAVSSSRSRKPIIWAGVLVLLVVVATVAVWKGRSYWFKSAPQSQVVVLMDSPLPDRVYDRETRKNGGTNADDITDIISDLPIVIEKENTSPLWHREDQVLRERPALIVIHRSCFADATVGFDLQSPAVKATDKKLDDFLGYIGLGNPNTKFLVYTRRAGDPAPWVSDLQKRFPQLTGRIVVLQVPGGPEHATFRDPNTAKMVRQNVKSILGFQ